MKNLFKFTAAAVALFAFASCSDDISEYGGANLERTAANELKIDAEQMGGGSLTRSAYVGTTNARVWQESDVFRVFGPEIVGKYDYYKFDKASNKFVLDGAKDLSEPAYVAFPDENLRGQDWDKKTGSGFITYEIPAVIDYDEVSGSDPMAYFSNLPLWGTAAVDGDGISAKVYFLTSIIKVYLTNALGNASAVRVSAFNDIEGTEPAAISGWSTVQVSKNNEALSASEVALSAPQGVGNTITVNLGDLTEKSANSVIYIPLIAGYYGKVNVEYYDVATTSWKLIRSYLDKTFARATPYGKGNEKEFEIDASSISAVNTILANMAASASGETVVTLQNAITNIDEELTIPAMANVTSLTLQIPDFDATAADLTVAGDFAGTLTLDAGANTSLGDVEIRTKNANVIIGGTWTSDFTFTYAKDIQFGGLLNDDEEEIAANYAASTITLKAGVGDVTVAEKATVGDLTLPENHKTAVLNVLGIADAITVNASTLAATTAVNVSGTAGAITINGDKNNATVALSGVAASITNAGTGAITISGNPVYAATNAKKVGAVSTFGDVTINLDNEGVAIKGGLTFNAPATFTLTQGYVDAITVKTGADTKVVTCTLGNEKYVTLPNPTITSGKFTVSNAPTWNGEKIGGSFDTEAEETAIKAVVGAANYTKPTDWAGYADAAAAIYTPIGFAEQIGAAAVTLANDIDLNNKAWTPAASAGAVAGQGKTIKNLTVAVQVDKDATAADAGRGLFTELKHNVSNLTLDGVTIAAVPYKVGAATTATVVSNIGALAGKLTTNAVTISNVAVKNIALSSTEGGNTIGGVIGANTSAATLNGVIVSGTNAIKGYGKLGGLIGNAGAAVTVGKIAKDDVLYGTTKAAADIVTSATASFTANYNSAEANDLTYLRVGNMIGSAGNVVIVIADVAADVKPTLTYDKSIFTGTTAYQTIEDEKTVSYPIVSDKQTLIGYCGFAAGPATPFTTAPKFNTKDFGVYVTKAAVEALPANAQNYLYYINK